MRYRWAAAGAVAGAVVAVIAFLSTRSLTREAHLSTTVDMPVVVQEIQHLNELVTVKYTVQKVVGLEEKKVPLGSEKLLLIVQAEVLAGTDLSRLSARDVKLLARDRIQVKLPAPKIIQIAIDDKQTKVWDRQITWWTPWVPFNPDLERKARLQARDEIQQAAIQMGILDQARQNADTAIRSLLLAFGLKAVTIGNT